METRSSIINKLNNEYRMRREGAYAAAAERRERLFEALPEAGELDRQIRLLTVQMNRALINDDSETQDRLMLERKALADKYEALLAVHGYGNGYTEPSFRCKMCNDTGQTDSGTCPCYKNELLAALYRQLNVDGAGDDSFENFDLSIFPEKSNAGVPQRDQMQAFYNSTVAFCDKFPDTARYTIVFNGFPGLGKTYLLNCMGKRVLQRGYSVLKLTAFKLMEVLKNAYLNDADSVTSLDDLLSVDLLLIDDLGTEPRYNNITVEYLFSLINERVLAHRHTVIATNLTPSNVKERYGERIYSRLSDGKTGGFFEIKGDDVRTLG